MIRRLLKRVAKKVTGGDSTPKPESPKASPQPPPRPPIPNGDLPAWMQPEAEDQGHSHSHGHSHDHGGGDEHEEDAPAPSSVMVVPTDTPNPNAFKFTVNRKVVTQGSLSFNSEEEAKDHPLGAALFAIGGVSGIFGVNDFVTVTKADDATWDQLIPKIETILKSELAESE